MSNKGARRWIIRLAWQLFERTVAFTHCLFVANSMKIMTSKVQYMLNYIRCNYALDYHDIFFILKEDFLCCFLNDDFLQIASFSNLPVPFSEFWLLDHYLKIISSLPNERHWIPHTYRTTMSVCVYSLGALPYPKLPTVGLGH